MGMPETIRRWTREEVLALPDDGNRYELIDGELLVSPSPRGLHQRAVIALLELVGPYLKRLRLGSVGLAPSDLDLKSGQVSQPDLFAVHRKPDGREPIDWVDYGIPFFIAEVTSPSTARYDRITKRRRYQRSGVAEYWIVDPDARVIERWRPEDDRPEVLDETLVWHPAGAPENLSIDVGAYFRRVWAEED
jgi:Uma2 family endonuclease